ncbi:hypothetical protein G6F57_022679 [Rhizopus arrhizus]|nr:hypothetical protein G6F57_022679 [Rhizopus arrhizus]
MPIVAARAAAIRRATQDSPPPTGLAAPQTKTKVARRCRRPDGAQPRCARGNLKEAALGRNEDDEGVVRSEGS